MENKKSKNRGALKLILIIAAGLLLMTASFFAGSYLSSSKAGVPGTEANRALLTSFDYGDEVTYVIGHKSPDADTVMSAIAMANLLNELGIKAEARMAGTANGEVNYAAAEFGITLPELLTDATDKQLFLVDHSTYSQTVDGTENARIVGILDHHGIGNTDSSEQIFVYAGQIGASATMIWKLYRDCGVEIDKSMAEVMLVGILSDTSYATKAVTKLDEEALADLKSIAGLKDVTALCAGMKEAKIAYTGMSDTEIYYNDYKDYESSGYRYTIGLATTKTVDEVAGMTERMLKVMQDELAASDNDFYVAMVYNTDHEYGRVIFVGKDETFVQELAMNAFIGAENYTGYEENAAIFTPSVSRKAVIVPAIDAYLKKYAK